MTSIDELIDGYLRESKIDYIPLPMIVSDVRYDLGTHGTAEVRKLSLEIVRRLYEKGLRPGDYDDEPFTYWPDEGCPAVLDRIEREWIAAGEDPNLGHPICWFA